MAEPSPSPVPTRPRQAGLGDVLVVAGVVVGLVLGAAALTGLLPVELQRLVFRTPLLIVVLLGGTAWLLWRITRRPSS